MLQKQILIGRVGKDVEKHVFDNGNIVVRFPLAVDDSYTKKDGEKVERAEWFNISAFGKLAEIIETYVKKGDLLYLETKQRTNVSERDGNKTYFVEHTANIMKMLGGNKQESNSDSNKKNSEAVQKVQNAGVPKHESIPEGEDSLPF